MMAAMIFAACKDPNTGPGTPQEDAGFIQFESPAVGQKSSFLHFNAKGYYEPTPTPISYTRDTIHWEVTKKIDRNTYEITERLVGDYFGDAAINRVMRYITLIKETDRVLLVTDRNTSSPLLGYRDTLSLPLGNAIDVPFMDWRVGEMNSTAAYDGYVSGYKVKDKEYEKLDVYSDFTPTHYDGFGLLFAYNSGYGMVRHYGMNPWGGDVNGFDLITDMKKRTDALTDLAGTKWRLKNVSYKDGRVKSIKEVLNGMPHAERFIAEFQDNNLISGLSGCNTYAAEYEIDGVNISIDDWNSTKVLCTFGAAYYEIMLNSTTFSATEGNLIINSDYEEYSGLEFERVTDILPHNVELIGTKWKLRAVHYPKGNIVPIDRVLGENGSNNAFNQFVLEFMEDDILSGFSGCNTFGGTYKLSQPEIKMEVGNITQMACEFSNEYSKILNAANTLTADPNKLTIYTRLDGYVALEYDRVR